MSYHEKRASGSLYEVAGELINLTEIAHRADCSIARARKYLVIGSMDAETFIKQENNGKETTSSRRES